MHDVKRDEQMRRWVNAGPEDCTPVHENVVMWGIWFDVNGDEYKPPAAMFGTEEDANEYAKSRNHNEWAVSPCVVSLKTRDDFRIPPPEHPNVCEHGDHEAPPGQRFCSEGCRKCDSADQTGNDCAGLCGATPES